MGNLLPASVRLGVGPGAAVRQFDFIAFGVRKGGESWGLTEQKLRESQDDPSELTVWIKIFLGRMPVAGVDSILVGCLHPPTVYAVPIAEVFMLGTVVDAEGMGTPSPSDVRNLLVLRSMAECFAVNGAVMSESIQPDDLASALAVARPTDFASALLSATLRERPRAA